VLAWFAQAPPGDALTGEGSKHRRSSMLPVPGEKRHPRVQPEMPLGTLLGDGSVRRLEAEQPDRRTRGADQNTASQLIPSFVNGESVGGSTPKSTKRKSYASPCLTQ
jgi:hypothetical protein